MENIIYFACCTADGGIYAYRLSTEGQITFLNRTPAAYPMYLARKQNQMYVLTGGNGEGRLVRYNVQPEGVLTDYTDLGSTNGVCACHLWPEADRVYVTNYLSGNLVSIPGITVQQTGKGPHPVRQCGPHTHYVCTSPDKQYVLAVNLGNDTIYTYTKDLQEVARANVSAGQGCRHLAFSEDGTLCYCANELGNTVTVFGYKGGILTAKESYRTLPPTYTAQNTVAAIRVYKGYVYVSNRGHDSVAAFRICGEKLICESITPTGGKSPRDFNIFKDMMVITNEQSNLVTFFRVCGSRLEKMQTELSLPCPLCVIE